MNDALPSQFLPGADEPLTTLELGSALKPLTIRRPSEILAMQFSDDDKIIGDYIVAAEQPTTIVGPAGAGKSRLVLQAAVDTILNRPFLSFRTQGTGKRWLFFNAENSNRRLKSDMEWLERYAGRDWPTVDGSLQIHTLETEDDGYLSLSNPTNAIRIENAIRDINPDIVVFDPLQEFRMGDLNTDDAMLSTCHEISRLAKAGNPKRAFIVLHHTLVGRAGAAKAVGYDRGSYGRNSKALLGWTRAQVNLAPGSANDNALLVVSCGKCSNGREFEPFAIRLDPEAMIYRVEPGFDLPGWQAEFGGQTKQSEPLVTLDDVRELCAGGKTKPELAKAIMAEGVGRTYAYKLIKKADVSKKISYTKVTNRYVQTP